MPLGKPVPFDDLPYKNLDERKVNNRPEFEVIMDVKAVEEGFDINIQTLNGLARVPFTITFLFAMPGYIETEYLGFKANPQQRFILKNGCLTYRVNQDAVTIGPGFYGFRNVENTTMNISLEQCGIVLSDWTPVSRCIKVRCGRWAESEGVCHSYK